MSSARDSIHPVHTSNQDHPAAGSIRFSEDARPLSEPGRLVERAEALDHVRVAEEQIARGEGIEHEEAKRRVLGRPRR